MAKANYRVILELYFDDNSSRVALDPIGKAEVLTECFKDIFYDLEDSEIKHIEIEEI